MSDTGGGHRASAEAIQAALERESNDEIRVKIIDVFQEYAPYPLSRLPDWYPVIVSRGSEFWRRGFHMSDGLLRAKALNHLAWPYVRGAIRKLIRENPADVIICVPPLFVGPVLQGLGKPRPPFITVVTDLISSHSWWFDKRTDLTLVPTEDARRRALTCGLDPGLVKVVGLPISKRFYGPQENRVTLRKALGWQPDVDTVLLLGGADGIGPLRDITHALAQSSLPIQLAIVCGRNRPLRAYLSSQAWPLDTHVYGFVRNMQTMMLSADLVVTKAGPSSVIETLTCGRPLVLCSAVPGQEEGTVRYIVENGAGLWAPTPEKVVKAVKELVSTSTHKMAVMATNAKRLTQHPDAAHTIAQEICCMLPRLSIA